MKTWTDPLRLSQGRRLEGGDRKKAPMETTVKNPWIAGRLKMGHPNEVSNLVHG